MRENVDLQDSEADETLSFRDLPLNDESELENYSMEKNLQPSSDHELFEFLDLSSENFPSQDIIFCGKILHKEEDLSDENFTENHSKNLKAEKTSFLRRLSKSLNGLQTSNSSLKDRLFRNSLSLNYRKLCKHSSSKAFLPPSPARAQAPVNKQILSSRRFLAPSSPVKPRQHLFMFGLLKFPREMELSDIRNRQNRRNPPSIFPAFDGGETVSVKRGKSSWRLLIQAWSCTGHANAVVTASFGCLPRPD